MTTKQLKTAIQEIDEELNLLLAKNYDINSFKPLLKLRNKLIVKYKPCPHANWQITNEQLLEFLQKENWGVLWIPTDTPVSRLQSLQES